MYDPSVAILTWLIAVVLVLALLDAARGARLITDLRTVSPAAATPAVSVIVAARNEERGIEGGLRSLLALDYPALEIIVVNDRSTDGTGSVLARLAQNRPGLVVLTVDRLPDGWLGKNHALALGASKATGGLLLFTDADVLFEPTMLARAVAVLEGEDLDHLAAIPDIDVRGIRLRALVLTFGILFSMYTRPWMARNPRSRHHIGIGAFNLVRRSAYERIGTHAAIALRPDDDLRLGRAVKTVGLKQDVVYAHDLLAVEWYTSVADMVNGLMKNAFAGVFYSVPALIGSTVALILMNVWPWVALVTTSGGTRAAAVLAVAALLVLVVGYTSKTRMSPLYALLYPLGVLGFVYILWRSALLALSTGAITWRETSYSLKALREARPAAPLSH